MYNIREIKRNYKINGLFVIDTFLSFCVTKKLKNEGIGDKIKKMLHCAAVLAQQH